MSTQLRAAELAADAARLRARGLTIRQIAKEQGCSTGAAYKRLQRAYNTVMVEAVDELRRTECDRLDAVIARLWDVVDAEHLYVSQGRAVRVQRGYERDADGIELLDPETAKPIPHYEPVHDSGPVIAALTGIIRASESKRKLLGLDAPTRTAITVITEDAVDARLRQLDDEWAALNGGTVPEPVEA